MHKEFDTNSSENEEARVAKRKRVQSDDETERIHERGVKEKTTKMA